MRLVEVAEGWAFTAAILPQIALCDADVATLLATNLALSLDGAGGAHVASGFVAVKEAAESVYPCLRISCADVMAVWSVGAGVEEGSGEVERRQGGVELLEER